MFRSILFLIIFFLISSTNSLYSQENSKKPELGDLKFEPIKTTVGGREFEGELGRLIVKENRSDPKSNLIELAFVRLKSTAEKPGYPVVYLDGGPGSSAIGLARIPAYMNAFQKMREVGDVILLNQRGVGFSKPRLSYRFDESLPADFFASEEIALKTFQKRIRKAAEHFRSQGIDIKAYNTIESANDVEDIRKAIGTEKLNLVGFSYGTHLGLACLRYHGENLNRVVLIGTEGPDHTSKLPSTSDKSIEQLAELAARAPETKDKTPNLTAVLKRVMTRLEKEPVTITITDSRTKKPVDIKIGKFGLQFLIRRDLGDSNDLPVFPAWIYTMDKGDYSILKNFAERRYNQYGGGISIMSVMMDASSGTSQKRLAQIQKEEKNSILGSTVNFPSAGINEIIGNPDLGNAYRSPVKTNVPTLFISGTLDNNTPPFQSEEVRKTFKNSTHLIVENAGHESMLTDPKVQETLVDFLNGKDVSKIKLTLPPLEFIKINSP